jgi:protein-ribulosamine 3-kinase
MTLNDLAASICACTGTRLRSQPTASIGGGSINECYRWESSAGPIFVKVASTTQLGMLEAEAAGLEELRRANAVRVPAVLGTGMAGESSWLALEWIRMGSRTAGSDAGLGERLASQHRYQAAEYGWHRDNTLGSTPQLNGWSRDWLTFFRERRLRHQLQLAASKGTTELLSRGELLLERLDGFFDSYRPVPSLLHGDLWGGNWAVDELGQPVIFDPAIYYGDREADLAMTRLFGGFGVDFYRAYEANWPLHPGAARRTALYNLYHVLNHFNLFGGGYLAQAMSMMDNLLR